MGRNDSDSAEGVRVRLLRELVLGERHRDCAPLRGLDSGANRLLAVLLSEHEEDSPPAESLLALLDGPRPLFNLNQD